MLRELQDILQLSNTSLLFSAIFFIACTFYFIRKSDTNTLLSIIVIGGIIWVVYGYLREAGAKSTNTRQSILKTFDDEGKLRAGTINESHGTNVTIPAFSRTGKGFKYLAKNSVLVEIAKDLEVMRIFNRGAYADLLLLMNTLQKTYMYILADRYDAYTYMPIFADIGDSILENLYQLILVLPLTFKHVYGIDSKTLIQTNIDRFILLRRTMSQVLESYAKKELGVKIVPLALPKASDAPFSPISYRKIP